MGFPKTIRKFIGNRPYSIDQTGMSGSRVLRFEDMVLKIEAQGEEPDNERRMMAWLAGRLPVPQLLCFEQADGFNYLLMSRLRGEMCCAPDLLAQPEQLVRLLAEGLRMLWRVDTSDCPYVNSVDNKLRLARESVRNNLCGTDDAEPETYGPDGFKDPAALLEWLERNKPAEDLVFSHGDYCLPNVFAEGGGISGFIDLGRSGVADRYQDIALCCRSLQHNFDGAYGGRVYGGLDVQMLFVELGIEPDWEKIKYYILLDELF